MTEKPLVVPELLRSQLRGALCYPGEPEYDQARTIWNAMVDKRPAAVIRAAGESGKRSAITMLRPSVLAASRVMRANWPPPRMPSGVMRRES